MRARLGLGVLMEPASGNTGDAGYRIEHMLPSIRQKDVQGIILIQGARLAGLVDLPF